MSIRDELERILPEVLPESPDEAIWGTRLAEVLRSRGLDEKTSTLTQTLSDMSRDPTSPIAKVVGRHGYYLRPRQAAVETPAAVAEPESRRASQPEEKFRSLFMRWVEQDQQFPWHLEHTQAAKQQAGLNKWKYPDVLAVNWAVLNDDGRLDEAMLQVRQGLGDQPFRIISTELKVDITSGSLREAFFQCVSNSRWAHSAQLAIARKISDDRVVEELKRLGTSYDVSVVSFGLSPETIDGLPPADRLLAMSDDEVETLLQDMKVETIASGQERDALDWEHIRDLQTQHPDIKAFFEWIAKCLEHKRAYARKDWETIIK